MRDSGPSILIAKVPSVREQFKATRNVAARRKHAIWSVRLACAARLPVSRSFSVHRIIGLNGLTNEFAVLALSAGLRVTNDRIARRSTEFPGPGDGPRPSSGKCASRWVNRVGRSPAWLSVR